MTRWSLVVDDQTDKSLRAFLGQQGSKKGALSKFVEQAVLDKLFQETVQTIKSRNEDMDQNNILHSVDEALEAIRAHRP